MCQKEYLGKIPIGDALQYHVQGKPHKKALAALGTRATQPSEPQSPRENNVDLDRAFAALEQFCTELKYAGLLENKPAANVLESFYRWVGVSNAQLFKAAFNSVGGVRKLLDRSTQRPLRYYAGGLNPGAHRIRFVVQS